MRSYDTGGGGPKRAEETKESKKVGIPSKLLLFHVVLVHGIQVRPSLSGRHGSLVA